MDDMGIVAKTIGRWKERKEQGRKGGRKEGREGLADMTDSDRGRRIAAGERKKCDTE